jgi:hypothetical protein
MIWIEVLVIGVVIGALIAFILSLVVKWELHHKYYVKTGIRVCLFCVAFWLSGILTMCYIATDAMAGIAVPYIFILPISTIIGIHVKLPG